MFANDPGDRGFKASPTNDLKLVLDASLLSTHYKVEIKGKVEQSRERSCALPYAYV